MKPVAKSKLALGLYADDECSLQVVLGELLTGLPAVVAAVALTSTDG